MNRLTLHKTARSWLIALGTLSLLPLLGTPSVYAGSGVKGGSFCDLEVKTFALGTVYPWLKVYGNKITPPLNAEDFLAKLMPAAIRCISHHPKAEIPDLKQDLTRSAVNASEIGLALFYDEDWQANKDDRGALAGMIVHEMAPTMKWADEHNQISAQVAVKMRETMPSFNARLIPTPANADPYLLWCDNVREELGRARDNKNLADDNSHAQAAELYHGLKRATQIAAGAWTANPPIAFYALTRGKEMADALIQGLDGVEDREDMILDFLEGYYGLLDKIFDSHPAETSPQKDAKDGSSLLDQIFGLENFEITYLQDMIGWLGEHYLVAVKSPDALSIAPVWDNFTLFFTLSDAITHLADGSPLQNTHACALGDLNELGKRIHHYREDPDHTAVETRKMFERTVVVLSRVKRELNAPCSANFQGLGDDDKLETTKP